MTHREMLERKAARLAAIDVTLKARLDAETYALVVESTDLVIALVSDEAPVDALFAVLPYR